ncbi:MAG TPA: IclR family transcriptional regulator C-terminal domain-containing protein [Stellaceae bacterium]|nr:IclR family transcriptional regulator C-terminal domain-containing protein [Stellaceae bacterium]
MSARSALREVEAAPRGQSDGPLERYLRILETAAGFSDGIGLSSLAEILELPKTTAHRLAHNLVETGMLTIDDAGRYRLGDRFARLTYAGTPDDWINSVGHTLLRDLADATGQACFIARLTDNKIKSVALVAPDTLVRAYVLPGRELWPHAAAAAKAILAYQTAAALKAVLPSPLPRLTDRTKTRLRDLQGELESVRAQGVALCVGEDVEGFAGIACPVLRPGFDVLYSVGISGTIETLINRRRGEFEQRLRGCAVKIARMFEERTR